MLTLWKTSKKDFFSWTGCLIVCLAAGVEMGLLYGIVLNMIFVLLRLGNPRVEVNLKQVTTLDKFKIIRVVYFIICAVIDLNYSALTSLMSRLNRSQTYIFQAQIIFAPRYVRRVRCTTTSFLLCWIVTDLCSSMPPPSK